MGALRNVPELLWALRTQGFTYSICSASFSQGVSGFWTQAFAFSKVVELIDTAFIVARKRPLTFLHCYHHCTVMIYTWHAYKEHTASGRWFICMNYSVHALMYTYYALMTLKWFRIPKRSVTHMGCTVVHTHNLTPRISRFSMFVTLCQLAQMVMGVAIGVKVWRMSQLERATCQQTQDNLYLTFAIYFSYFLLFLNFFLQAYVRGRGGKSDTATSRVDATKAGVSNVLAKIRDEDRSFLSQPSNGTSSATANGDLHGSNHWHERNGGGLVRKENDRQSPPLTRLRRRQKEDVETEREPNHSG